MCELILERLISDRHNEYDGISDRQATEITHTPGLKTDLRHKMGEIQKLLARLHVRK